MWPSARTCAKSRTRRSSRLATRGVPRERLRDLHRRVIVDRHAEDSGRAPDNLLDVVLAVVVEPMDDAEAGAQGRRQQARARRGADERVRLERHLHGARAGPLPDHDVEHVVFHRRIQRLLDRRRHAVDFVDEEHVTLLEVA